MRILVVCNQRPLPTFHGANADIWRVIRALQTAGAELACVTWRDSIADDHYLPTLRATLPRYHEIPMDYGRHRGYHEIVRVPEFASHRRMELKQLADVHDFSHAFAPDCVLLIGLYGAELAIQLSSAMARPLIYRSHAIETQYHIEYFRLRRSSEPGRLRSMVLDRAQIGAISRLEQMAVARSVLTLEVSADDLRARQRHPRLRIEHLPPFVSTAMTELPSRSDTHDLCYVGNFFMPNNQSGIRWFARDVVPRLLAKRGATRIAIAGKSFDRDFVRALERRAVDVIPNPADVDAIIAGSRVGVNPIFSGNGTTLKTLDYLWSGCSVVTSPIGLQGYRFEDSTVPVTVATSAESFADAIAAQLDHPLELAEIRAKLARFTWESGGPQLVQSIAAAL